MLENYKDVLTARELCEVLPLGRCKIYELLRAGTIRNIKVGKKIIIPKEYVLEFLGCSGGEVV